MSGKKTKLWHLSFYQPYKYVTHESIFNSPTIADAINEEIGTLTDELTLKSQTVVELTEEMVR